MASLPDALNILILEPYFCRSHESWALGFAEHSRHDVEILSMKGAFWKWRMHGGAVTLARRFLEGDFHADLLIASDMLDLPTFLALTRQKTARVPSVLYFHENQLSYPWSPDDRDKSERRDFHYGFVNYTSALAADAVFFNSKYHKDSFLKELVALLDRFPDHNETANAEQIEEKSQVLPLGLDLKRFDDLEPFPRPPDSPPRILWNHRWEYDKNPEDFFDVLLELERRGVPFELAVLGQSFRRMPDVYKIAKTKLAKRIVHFGFEPDASRYARWLLSCDILPVTSRQDFFGISVMEAVYCGCFPLLPKRLAYPELFPPAFHKACFYDTPADLVERLESILRNPERLSSSGLRDIARPYDWRLMAPRYDRTFEEIVRRFAMS